MTNSQVQSDMARPTKSGDQTVKFIDFLLWIVAAGIIGSIVYLSALERLRDFAVMKAVGASNRALLTGLALQALVLSSTAAALAAVLAKLLAPGFPFTVHIAIGSYVALLVVAVVVGLLASTAGLRRAVKIDPAIAFGGV
jgi:putative ABC transport system permease protein